jgi:hypothetical protein
VSRSEWPGFFNDFSRTHEGRPATLEVIGRDLGAQIEAEAMPLIGVSAASGENIVWVALARDEDEHITHGVHDVTHVRVENNEAGTPVALQMESRDGVVTLLRFEGITAHA